MSSFTWLAYAGLKLDPYRHVDILRYLNKRLWPVPYAHIRRMADFQNRVFAAYAAQERTPFFDIDRDYPRDPDLFDDAIHLNYAGVRLQGWIFLQHLVPLIDRRLADGRWPRPPKTRLSTHPAFAQPSRRLVAATDVLRHCP